MLSTAHRVLSTSDARDYMNIVTAFLAAVSRARSMVDVNIAAGIAEQELEDFRRTLLEDDGQVVGKANLHVLKPL